VSSFLSSPRSGITVSPQPAHSHSLQPIYFQQNTHSFAQRRQSIPRSFNHLRLPAVEGTLLPLTTSFFSSSLSAPSAIPSIRRFLFSFQQLAASLPPPKKSTPLQSSKSSLFLQNTRGGGGPAFDIQTFRPSDVQTRASVAMGRPDLQTFRHSDIQTWRRSDGLSGQLQGRVM